MYHFRWQCRLLLLLIVATILLDIPNAAAQFSVDYSGLTQQRAPTPRATPAVPQPKRYRVAKAANATARAAITASGAQIEQVVGDSVEVLVTAQQMQRLKARGYKLEPLDYGPPDPAYHTYDEMVADVQAVAAAHPDIVQLSSIGKSYEGRALLMAKVGNNVATDENEPEALFVGHYHAREHITIEMMLYIFHMLVEEYGQSGHEDVTNLVNSREIWLVFDLNPDGGEYDWTHPMWRKNRQPNPGSLCIGIDENRDHSYKWGVDTNGSSTDPCNEVYRGSAPASALEVAALQQFINSRVVNGRQRITVAITFHSYSELILWPYGYTNTDVPADMQQDDHDVFVAMGKAMAATNGYTAEQASDLYPVNGDLTDWAYGTQHIFAYTFEMYPKGNQPTIGFYPPASDIGPQIARNRAAVLYLLAHADCPYATIGKAATYCATAASTPARVWLPLMMRGNS